MALKLQHSRVHPFPPNVPFHPTRSDESVQGKSCPWLCKRKERRKRRPDEEEEDDELQSKKPKTCSTCLKDKCGGIYLLTHQTLCLVLFCSIETRVIFENLVFPDLLIPVIAGVLLLLSQILILVTIMMDPGVQPRRSEQHQQLEANFCPSPVLRPMIHYGETILGDYCFECRHFKHPRTHHCKFCDRCIVRYDHHCNILGTCVGVRNFPFFFYLLFAVFFYYLYVTSISVVILVRKLAEDKPTFIQLVQNVSVVWIIIISLIMMILCNMEHLLLFPCVYLYITALDRTARELFYVIETGDPHHYKCYKVIKSIQLDRKESCPCGCLQILKNLRHSLCTPTLPSLLKESNYHVVCDLDEILIQDMAREFDDSLKNWSRSKIKTDLDHLLHSKEEEQLELNLPSRQESCCKL